MSPYKPNSFSAYIGFIQRNLQIRHHYRPYFIGEKNWRLEGPRLLGGGTQDVNTVLMTKVFGGILPVAIVTESRLC